MCRNALSWFILVDNELIKVTGCSSEFMYIGFYLLFDWFKGQRNGLFQFQSIRLIIRVLVSIMLSSSFEGSIPFSGINLLYELSFHGFRYKHGSIGESFNFFHQKSQICQQQQSEMSDYKQLVRMMFNSWFKTHELSAMIVDQQIRRNNIKRLEGNYRVKDQTNQRFQHEIEYRYKPQEEIDTGLLKYHHQLAEKQYMSILLLNHQLANKSFKLNPYPRRQENFQLNRQHNSKIDFSDFANNNSQ